MLKWGFVVGFFVLVAIVLVVQKYLSQSLVPIG